jgi:polygalacturonase
VWAFPFLLCAAVSSSSNKGKICDVTLAPWNAKGDNATEDTTAVQSAVIACAPGGMVLLPAGYIFLLRPIELPSHIELQLEGNIAGWRDIKTWPNSTTKLCPTTPYGTPRAKIVTVPQKEGLIWSLNSSFVTISGKGTIDGGGWRWWPLRKLPGHYWHNCRPGLVEFGRRAPYYDLGVPDLVVKGVTLKDSPFWTFSGRDLTRATISDVHVTTSGCGYANAPNTDGFNIRGQDILIEHCTVRNGGDCVPIFPPTRNVTVRNISCECGSGLVPGKTTGLTSVVACGMNGCRSLWHQHLS